MRWRRFRVPLLVVLVVLGAAGVILWRLSYRFDADAWKNASTETDRRWRMYEDLVSRHKLVGMTRADVTGLLGKPDEVIPGPFNRNSLPGSREFDHYQAD